MTGSTPGPRELAELLGGIDIYLLDQVLRGRFEGRPRVLDAGSGTGRNVAYLLRAGFEVHAVDPDPEAIARLRRLAAALRPDLPAENFRAGTIEEYDTPAASFDAVLSIAVLHFAADPGHFEGMLRASWRPLRPGGLFFCRLATSIGIEACIAPLGRGRYRLGDGSERFLVGLDDLRRWAEVLGGTPLDPIKTTDVEHRRAMTTWVLQRDPASR